MIYLDHSATTPLAPEVFEKMKPWLTQEFGNATSIYAAGQRARNAIESARRTVAKILFCKPEEIIFTSGGTESDNLALRGVLRTNTDGHAVISKIEHHAILRTAEDLAKDGFSFTKIGVDKSGKFKTEQIEKALQPNTKLVSIMLANNEIGVIEPVREIGKMLQKKHPDILLHTDAVQAGGILNIDVQHLKVDLLSLSGHKFYGPKGIGILFVRNGVKLRPTQTGGTQEHKRRAGTENVAVIVGFAEALKIANMRREKESARLKKLRDYFIRRVLTEIPQSQLNGHAIDRLPGNTHFSFYGIEGESILLRLDLAGIAASSGSACTSGSLDPSHVLTALKLNHKWLHSSIRFTLGRSTKKRDINRTVIEMKKIVNDLRSISPLM